MSDFLGRLAARALGMVPPVRPRMASRFEPAAPWTADAEGPPGEETGEEIVAWEGGVVPGAAPESLSRGREESSRPSGAPLPRQGRALPTLGRTAPEPGKSSPDPREHRSPAREESSRPSGAPLPGRGRALPTLGKTSPDPGKSLPEAPEDLARPTAEPSRSSGEPFVTVRRPAVEPRRPGAPLAPPSEDSAPSEPFMSRPAAEPPRAGLPAGALEHPSLVPRPALGGEPGLPRLSSSPAIREPVVPSEPTIEVTIGRIEVKAPPQPPPPPVRSARQGPRVTLTEYLRRRQEGR